MGRSPWAVAQEDDGRYVVTWKGRPWVMEPKEDREWAEGYCARVAARYPDGPCSWQLRGNGTKGKGRSRGGPWRYDLPDGTSGVIHTKRKSDALATLRHQLRRKRLPKGTTVRIADGN